MGTMVTKYAIGVDFGTESVGPSSSTSPTDGSWRRPSHRYRHGVIDERLAARGPGRAPGARLGAPGSRGLSRVFQHGRSRASCARPASIRPTSSASASTSPPARCCPATADGTPLCAAARVPRATRTPGSSSGSTTPRSPRPTGSTRSPASDRAGLAGPLRREDLVRVVLLEGAPDPRRGARGLRRGGPPDRGGRLGRLAADRRRDAERLHRRLQGDVVEARRLPRRAPTSRALDPRLRRRRRHQDARDCRPVGERAGGLSAEAAAWTGLPARDRGGRRQRRRPRRGPGRDRHRAGHAWS